MGIGFVLLIWAVIGVILASLGAIAFGGATALLTQGVVKGRRPAIVAAGLFPFVCLGWAAGLFVFQAVINEGFLHRDAGIGDGFRCPLPNGYEIGMIDVTDYGQVYNPKTQKFRDSVVDQEDSVGGVRIMQVAGNYILGGADSRLGEHFGQNTSPVDAYFLLETGTGKRADYATYEELRGAAARLGIVVNLEPIGKIYSRYRFSWFDVLVGVLFVAPVLVSAVILGLWILRLRRTRELAAQSA